jgi:murein DD-endopeptidase MepM/ murein hydrolase activator NlpD|tara:strand:+ start:6309 stop:7559 length:1251 start_codon:yes stop_codon:yes gene_type:complete
MIGFKRVSFKYVVAVFVIFIAFVLLINLDIKNNPELPIEDVFESEEINSTSSPTQSYDFYTVKDGENLSIIFEEFKVPLNTAYKIFRKDTAGSLRDIRPGNKMRFTYLDDEIIKIEVIKDNINSLIIDLNDEISIVKTAKEPEIVTSFKSGIISSSFYEAGLKSDIPDSVIMDLAYLFGWDIDFVFDIRKGDTFKLIYETVYAEGEIAENGDIVFAEFINQGEIYNAYRFFNPKLGKEYYDSSGNNIKKAFLRAPLDFAYISSHFNPNRMHPILHRIKAHNGVDYAAVRNTPIRASGDGVIKFIGTKSGYGRTVQIKHGGNISTLYAHMESFNNKLKVGSKVSQGQTIGYVGDSGAATGTHLHYEFKVGSKRTDPMRVKLPSAQPVPAEQTEDFFALLAENNKLLERFNNLDPNAN